MYDGNLPSFDPPVVAIDGLVAADLGVLEIYCLLFIDEELDVVFERALISLQGENVIGFLFDDRLRDIALTAHRVDRHDRPLDRQHAQQFGNGDDLVGFFPYLHLTRTRRWGAEKAGTNWESGAVSVVFSPSFPLPRPSRWRAAKADTMWIGPLGSFFFLEVFEPDRR